MANGVDFSAKIQLQAPTNLKSVVGQIQSSLKGINANVDVKISPQSLSAIKSLNQNLVDVSSSLKQVNTSLSANASVLANVSSQYKSVGVAANTTKNAMNAVAASSSNVNKNVKESVAVMDEFGRQAGLAVRRFTAFSLAAGTLISSVVAFKDAIKQALEFERGLIRIQAIAGGTDSEIRSISDNINKLSSGLGVAAKDLVETALTLKQAGLSVNELNTALKVLAQTALSPNFDVISKTADGAIAIMAQFKIGADQLEKALAAVNAVSGAFAVEARDIIDAVRRTGGAFSSIGGSLEEFIALFTSVRATTRESAESIATGLRTIFTRLQRKDVVDSLKELGISLRLTKQEAEASGDLGLQDQFVGAYEAIQRISSGLKGLRTTDVRFSNIVEELGGYRQIGKVIPLLQETAKAEEALNIARFSGNSLLNTAQKTQQSYLQQLEKIKQQFLELGRTVVENPFFRRFLDDAIKLAQGLLKLGEALTPLVPLFSALAAIKIGQGLFNFLPSFFKTVTYQQPTKPFARGGIVPGSGNTDSISARLTPGEFVLRKDSAQAIGYGNLEKLNKYADGGSVLSSILRKNEKGTFSVLDRNDNVIVDLTRKEIERLRALKDSTNMSILAALGDKAAGKEKSIANVVTNLRKNPIDAVKGSNRLLITDTSLGIISQGSVGVAGFGKLGEGTSPKSLERYVNSSVRQLLSGYDKVAIQHDSHIVSDQVRETFQNKFRDRIIGGIKGTFKEQFGADFNAQFDNTQVNSILGTVFEKYVAGLFGLSLSGTEAGAQPKFDITGGSKRKTLGNFIYPTPLKANEIDIKTTYSGENIVSLFGKYLNSHPERIPRKFAKGGSADEDTVAALLTPGEYVFNKQAAGRLGLSNLNYMNKTGELPKFAKGGPVKFAEGSSDYVSGTIQDLKKTLNPQQYQTLLQDIFESLKATAKALGIVKTESEASAVAFARFNNDTKAGLQYVVRTAGGDQAVALRGTQQTPKEQEPYGPFPLYGPPARLASPPTPFGGQDTVLSDIVAQRAQKTITSRGGEYVLSQQTQGEILDKEKSQLDRQLLSLTARQIRTIDKRISTEEAYRLAQERINRAAESHEKVLVGLNGQLLGFRSEVERISALGYRRADARGGASAFLFDNFGLGGGLNRQGQPVPSFRERFRNFATGQGLQTLGVATFLGSQFLQPGQATATSGTGYKARVGAFGALQGAGFGASIGGSLGAIGGPVGAAVGTAVGAVVGALSGLVTSLKNASKEIDQARLDVAVKGLSNTLAEIAKGEGAPNARQLADLSTGIRTTVSQIDKKARDDASGFFTGFDKEAFKTLRQSAITDTLGSAGPQLATVINRQAVALAQNAGGASPYELNQRLLAGNTQNFGLLSAVSGKSQFDLLKGTQQLIEKTIRDEGLQKINQQAVEQTGLLVTAFGQLHEVISNSVSNLDRFSQSLSTTEGALTGLYNKQQATTFGGISSFGVPGGSGDFRQALGRLTGFIGPSGNQLQQSALTADAIRQSLPSVLIEAFKRPTGEGEEIGTFVTENLRKALETQGFAGRSPEVKAQLDSIRAFFGSKDIKDLRRESGGDIFKLLGQATDASVSPINKVLQESAAELAKALDFTQSKLAILGESVQRTGKLFDELADLRLIGQRQTAQTLADRAGRYSTPLDFLSLQDLDRPYQSRLERLGAGDRDADRIGGRLSANLREQEQAQLQLNTAKNPAEAFRAQTALLQLTNEAKNLQEALKLLGNEANRNAAVQEKLAQIENSRQSKTSAALDYLTSSPEEQLRKNQLLSYIPQARRGGLEAVPLSDRPEFLRYVQSLGGARLGGLGGQTANDFVRQLAEQAFGGGPILSPEERREKTDLETIRRENQAGAEGAKVAEIKFSEENERKFFENLVKNQNDFLTRLADSFQQVEINKIQARIGVVSQNKTEAERTLAHAAILSKGGLTEQQFERADLKPIFEQFQAAQRNVQNFAQVSNNVLSAISKGSFKSITKQDDIFGNTFAKIDREKFEQELESLSRGTLTTGDLPHFEQLLAGKKGTGPGNYDAFVKALQEDIGGAVATNRRGLLGNLDTSSRQLIESGVNPSAFAKLNEAEQGRFLSTLGTSSRVYTEASTAAKEANAELEKLTKQLQALKLAIGQPGGKVPGMAAGGLVNFAPRGTDVVPAMLSKGEFVVNSKSAQENLGLLQEINRPAYFAHGGLVSSSLLSGLTSIGDGLLRRRIQKAQADQIAGTGVGSAINEPLIRPFDLITPTEEERTQALAANPLLSNRRIKSLVYGQRKAAERNRYLQRTALGLGVNPGGAAGLAFYGTGLFGAQNAININYATQASELANRSNLAAQTNSLTAEQRNIGIASSQLLSSENQKLFNRAIPGIIQKTNETRRDYEDRTSKKFLGPGNRPLPQPQQKFFLDKEREAREAAKDAFRRRQIERSQKQIERFRPKFGFAGGGLVPGVGTKDTVPAMLTPGEVVMNKQAVANIGRDKLLRANKYAQGGEVTGGASTDFSGFISASDTLSRALVDFVNKSSGMVESLSKLNGLTMQLEARHTVELIVNGAEVLTQLHPTIKTMIIAEAQKLLKTTFEKHLPNVGPIDTELPQNGT